MSSTFAIDVPARLIDQARTGDMSALERIYRLFERPAYTLAFRLLADRDQAHEVLHDAMLNAFGRLEQFRGESPFWAWLRQIVANTALMRLRARKRLASLETSFPQGDDLMGDAGMAPIHAAELGALERAMTELPAITRSVIWLYCVEGYSHAEIAESMAQSISFSKSQLARGLARLRRLLNVEEMFHAGYA